MQAALHGVKLLRFTPSNATLDPQARYYTERRGLLNISACAARGAAAPTGSGATGPPVFVSLPHFCRADASIAEETSGTSCDESRHALWLGVEPTTGTTLAAAKRLQVSSAFDGSYPFFDPDLAPTTLPIFWAEELSEARESDTKMLKPVYRARSSLTLVSGRSNIPRFLNFISD
jgi:hypothetical protein